MTVGSEFAARTQLVDAAVKRWTKDLIDTGKRNPLLYFRDLQVGTLALDGANEAAVSAFLAGSTTRLTTLYPEPDAFTDALKRVRAIRRKILTLREERGIETGYLAIGMATWDEPDALVGGRAPTAPILLREIAISPRSASEDDFDLLLAEEAEFNPVLIHQLTTQLGVGAELETLPQDPDEKSWAGIADAFRALETACVRVPGFSTASKLAIGSFSYQKLPMVNDLQSGLELLAESDVIAALAGDTEAQASLWGNAGGATIEPSAPDYTPPRDEFLVLDADSSQNYAINAALAGNHVVIKGPPGTGKSQTIANLMAGLIARGKKVLFVAEKRAAIDAVLSRLDSADLGTWVMDLHDGLSNRRRVAQQLGETLDRASRSQRPDVAALHRELVTNRDLLIRHSKMMHTPHEPWDLSPYELQSRRIALGNTNIAFRLRGAALRSATPEVIAAAGQALLEFADLGGLTAAEAGAWSGAPVDTADQARQAMELVLHLRDQTVPETANALKSLISELGLAQPDSVRQWQSALTLITEVANLQQHLTVEAFGADQKQLIAATATRRWRKEHNSSLKWGDRCKAVKVARSMAIDRKAKKPALHTWFIRAAELSVVWRSASIDGRSPRTAADLDGPLRRFGSLTQELTSLGAFVVASDLGNLDPQTTLPQHLNVLAQERVLLHRLPRVRELERVINGYQLEAFVAECRGAGVGPSEVQASLEAAWLDSILEDISLSNPTYGAFQGATLSRAVDGFQTSDNQHVRSTGTRVQRAAAEALYSALDAFPDQALLVRKQANLKRRHMSMRDLLTQAGDVLLAAKPCWAMSPLVVSQVLPLKRMFDVVIFDEASQVPPADAIPSIARGSKLVVAGDERQLPPTAFFASNTDDSEEQDDSDDGTIAFTRDFESILDTLNALIPVRNLQWHYRSRDERLIAFSNTHIYDSSLTTFPGAHHDGVLKHVNVQSTTSASDVSGSSSAEVQQVVDLVLAHAETRPDESLGVIAMGIKHADRIDAAVRERLRDRDDLASFFSEQNDERFFVKNLERVQGDERDAIIMSVGYGKSPDGRMLYRFGPINNQGGERRLNVAVSRAKRRMTLVSSFGSADLDRGKLNARGAELLGAYVAFMESEGTDLGSFAAPPPALNAFEQDIRDRLTAAGLRLQPQFGVSGYRIDFVAAHPERPGQFVLAIEADGASYHSSTTARDRDRLRQEHLERLGWRFHRIWSTDWFRDPQAEVSKVLAAFEDAVQASNEVETVLAEVDRATTDAPRVASEAPPTRTAARPRIHYGEPITAYTRSNLAAVIRWIESDGLLRTEEDLIREAMAEFGWRRRGGRIDAGLRDAIAVARR